MKLRKALLTLSLAAGVLLLNPSAVFATDNDTEYTEDGSNDELTGSEIDGLDTVEDEHDVDDYGKSTTRSSGDTSTNPAGSSTTDNADTTEDDNSTYDPWDNDSSTDDADTSDEEDTTVDTEATEPTKKKVKTPKTADNMPVYVLGLISAVAAMGYAVFRKER